MSPALVVLVAVAGVLAVALRPEPLWTLGVCLVVALLLVPAPLAGLAIGAGVWAIGLGAVRVWRR